MVIGVGVNQWCFRGCANGRAPLMELLVRCVLHLQISEGSGRILVVATGTQSEWGKTMQLVGNAGSEDTPLQEKLADLAAAIGKIGFGVAVACFIALLIKW